MENKDFAIYDAKLAGLLMVKKCRLVTARPDKKDVKKMIFFFDNTDYFKLTYNNLKINKHSLIKMIEEFE